MLCHRVFHTSVLLKTTPTLHCCTPVHRKDLFKDLLSLGRLKSVSNIHCNLLQRRPFQGLSLLWYQVHILICPLWSLVLRGFECWLSDVWCVTFPSGLSRCHPDFNFGQPYFSQIFSLSGLLAWCCWADSSAALISAAVSGTKTISAIGGTDRKRKVLNHSESIPPTSPCPSLCFYPVWISLSVYDH